MFLMPNTMTHDSPAYSRGKEKSEAKEFILQFRCAVSIKSYLRSCSQVHLILIFGYTFLEGVIKRIDSFCLVALMYTNKSLHI
jgi:hypothetical protein